jgi:hypothetical protein
MKDKEVGILLIVASVIMLILDLGCFVHLGNTFTDAYLRDEPERWGNFIAELIFVAISIGFNIAIYYYGNKFKKEAIKKEQEINEEKAKNWSNAIHTKPQDPQL